MKLYELTGEMLDAINLYNSVESDEDLAKVEEKLTGLQLSFNDKVEAVAHYVLSLEGDVDKIENEVARLNALKKKTEAEAEWLRGYLLRHMTLTETLDIKSATVKVRVKTNPPSVIVDNADEIPSNFLREIPARFEPDKVTIKEALLKGEAVPGTHIERKQKLEIK